MAKTVDPLFVDEIKKLGASDLQACFNCGNCTATCPLPSSDSVFLAMPCATHGRAHST